MIVFAHDYPILKHNENCQGKDALGTLVFETANHSERAMIPRIERTPAKGKNKINSFTVMNLNQLCIKRHTAAVSEKAPKITRILPI
jgi:hypothetical protein